MRPSRIATIAALVCLCVACTRTPDTGSQEGAVEPTAPATLPSASPDEKQPLLPEDRTFVAAPLERYVPMWERPGAGEGPAFAFDTRNDFGQLVPLLIERAAMRDGEPWYRVLLPIRPNGTSAWVRDDDVRLREREDSLEVDLSERTLVRIHDGDVVERLRVGVGTDETPTTTGRFFIYIKVPYADPNQPYGIMALGLSGFSRVITDWPGGGRIAVHGTPYASDRGRAVSHGCVRVYNADMESLTHLPLGTPVVIHA